VFLLFLTVSNVASVLMWGDESLRAMMGSSTRIMGYPSHWNGIRFVVGVPENILSNIFSDPYAEISSWLQYYIIAGSYSLFGTSTFTTRFPFWIAGFAIFGVLYFYRHLLPKSDKVYILTTVLLLLNATFLVYTVQANYYIYALLLTLLSTFIFIKILSSDKISIVNL
ncbi:hypothetical protein COU87_05320, partial [Candidatus Roizmanbacteria bacterium CG10_big_fil_rev_8_21_14_0_10_39_12]